MPETNPREGLPPIDPTCIFHGLKWSEHYCLVCSLCYKDLTPDECWTDPVDGSKWDVCIPCREEELVLVSMTPEERKVYFAEKGD